MSFFAFAALRALSFTLTLSLTLSSVVSYRLVLDNASQPADPSRMKITGRSIGGKRSGMDEEGKMKIRVAVRLERMNGFRWQKIIESIRRTGAFRGTILRSGVDFQRAEGTRRIGTGYRWKSFAGGFDSLGPATDQPSPREKWSRDFRVASNRSFSLTGSCLVARSLRVYGTRHD